MNTAAHTKRAILSNTGIASSIPNQNFRDREAAPPGFTQERGCHVGSVPARSVPCHCGCNIDMEYGSPSFGFVQDRVVGEFVNACVIGTESQNCKITRDSRSVDDAVIERAPLARAVTDGGSVKQIPIKRNYDLPFNVKFSCLIQGQEIGATSCRTYETVWGSAPKEIPNQFSYLGYPFNGKHHVLGVKCIHTATRKC